MAKKTSFFATIASYNLVISNLLGPNNSKSKERENGPTKKPMQELSHDGAQLSHIS